MAAVCNLVVDRDLFEQPNGLCLSPDEKLLYVNDSAKKLIRVFNVAPDGSLSGERLFASEIRSSSQNGGPDGMKCDERGNVWVTGPGGVWVYAPSGELIGKLHIPEVVANLAWGGDELRTLFVTATHSVYRVTTKVGPRIEPYMRAHAAAMSASAPAEAPGLDLDPHRAVLIIQDMQNDAVSEGGAFAASGAPSARESAERGREHSPRRGGGAGSWRSRHSCLVRRRARRAWRHAERAAVQGARRAQGGGARDLGRGAGRRARA